MLGKEKCKILKQIRQRIADENDIPYVTRECTHQGACRGTCPRCESELRYLEQQLALRQSMGKRVAVTALCAAMAIGGAACGPAKETPPEELGGMAEPREETATPCPDIQVETGEIAWPEDPEDIEPTAGEPRPEEFELEGNVAYVPEPTAPGTDNG